jgi:hypothetical protein
METTNPTAPSERRSSKRYPVALPTEWEGGRGTVTDASRAGVYVKTSRPLPCGAALDFTLAFSGSPAGASSRLACRGRIVRLERLPGGWGAGVALNEVGFAPAAGG